MARAPKTEPGELAAAVAAIDPAAPGKIVPDTPPVRFLPDETRVFAVICAVQHNGEDLRENDAAHVTESQFEALQRAGAIDPDSRWLDGEIEYEA